MRPMHAVAQADARERSVQLLADVLRALPQGQRVALTGGLSFVVRRRGIEVQETGLPPVRYALEAEQAARVLVDRYRGGAR